LYKTRKKPDAVKRGAFERIFNFTSAAQIAQSETGWLTPQPPAVVGGNAGLDDGYHHCYLPIGEGLNDGRMGILIAILLYWYLFS
jgi:hypothetical protein